MSEKKPPSSEASIEPRPHVNGLMSYFRGYDQRGNWVSLHDVAGSKFYLACANGGGDHRPALLDVKQLRDLERACRLAISRIDPGGTEDAAPMTSTISERFRDLIANWKGLAAKSRPWFAGYTVYVKELPGRSGYLISATRDGMTAPTITRTMPYHTARNGSADEVTGWFGTFLDDLSAAILDETGTDPDA